VEKELAMVDINVKAMHLLMKLVLRKMERQDGGYLLNVASSAGLLPAGPYMATYYATKSYVASLTRAVAQELKEIGSNVYVGALCPGPVDTEFNAVANVEFALSGITPGYCAAYAIEQMKRRKVLIVPTLTMKASTTFGRFLPQNLCIRITGHQQKKKLGG
jgi:short-subunit dehydrogenase